VKRSDERHTPISPALRPKLDFGTIALLLQGGGALGAYQGGVYEALAETEIEPTWVAGISIGAINAAIIAGNAPKDRVAKLRQFWEGISATSSFGAPFEWQSMFAKGDFARSWFNQAHAAYASVAGTPGFFEPRLPPPWLQPPGTVEATSYYDTRPLKATLEQLVDFDRINAKQTRFAVGAVNVRTGNLVYFDSQTWRIAPEHVMASGALPPGFPAVEIEGEHYWDGGLVSNTPLKWVIENCENADVLAFQVDLWSARGQFPRTLQEVLTRQKEIQYSSRTRAGTTALKNLHKLRAAIFDLVHRLPDDLKDLPSAKLLDAEADPHAYNIVHLIYRPQDYEGDSKDFEFSRLTMEEHWRAGYNDAKRTLRHEEIFKKSDGVFTFDLAADGRD
jgi:NTE family protein